jgi:hypothetical protein
VLKAGLLEIRLADPDAALRLRALLDGNGSGARVRLVLGLAREEIVLALPESLTLPYQRRGDLERLEGFIATRDLALH